MNQAPSPLDADIEEAGEPSTAARNDPRLRAMVAAHYDFVWRSLRRLGIAPSAVDDAAQEAFWIAARKLDRIKPGAERAYLFGIVLRLASTARRQRSRNHETYDSEHLDRAVDATVDLDVLIDQKRARDLLDLVLDKLPLDLRTTLMLSEGEQLTMAEIAALLSIPMGTVGSRLRRAREALEAEVERLLCARRAAKKDSDGF